MNNGEMWSKNPEEEKLIKSQGAKEIIKSSERNDLKIITKILLTRYDLYFQNNADTYTKVEQANNHFMSDPEGANYTFSSYEDRATMIYNYIKQLDRLENLPTKAPEESLERKFSKKSSLQNLKSFGTSIWNKLFRRK
jgi:hypothetical protein